MEGDAEQEGSTAKKGPFDGLDREELKSKLKGLLVVYKNAKHAKDELAAENAHLKEALAAHQMQKAADKDHLKGLQASLQKLNETVAILEEQKQLDKNYMKGMHEMVDEVTNEKNTLSGRVTRLAQENEQLLGDCRKTDSILRQLNDSLGQHQQQVQQLQHMCEQQKVVNTDLRKQHATEVARNDQLAVQLTGVQTKCGAHEAKIKLYRTKLVDFSGQLKELRMCKEVLLTTVREYSQDVNKWQGEILTVSNQFIVQNRVMKDENRVLEERLTSAAAGSCAQCADTMQKYEELVVQFDTINRESVELSALFEGIQNPVVSQETSSNDDAQRHQDDLRDYRATLLQLDETLQNLHQESVRLQDVHTRELGVQKKISCQLEALVTDLQSQLEHKQAEINVKEESCGALKSNSSLLQNELELLRNSLEAIQSDLTVKDELVQSLQAKHLELVSELKLLGSNLKLSQDELKLKEDSHENLLAQLAELQAQVVLDQSQAQMHVSELVQQNETLEGKLVSTQNNKPHAESQSVLESIQAALDAAQVQLTLKDETHRQLESKISNLKGELMSLRNIVASNQAEINAKEKTIHTLETTITTKDATVTEHAQQLLELQALIESVQNELTTCQSLIATQKEALAKKSAEQSQHDQTMAKLQHNMKAQQLELSASKMCVDDLRSQVKTLRDASAAEESTKLMALQSKSAELTNTVDTLKLELSEAHDNLSAAKATFAAALLERDTSLATAAQRQADAESTLVREHAESMRDLEQRLDSDRQAIADLQSASKEAERKVTLVQSHSEQLIAEKENVIQSKQMEMDELLSEMRELNEALRNRGDIISKQEQRIAGLNAELTDKESRVERLVVEHEQLNERLREADSMPRMHDLSDQLSTSTVSRIEEISRMRDIDDSFEEKYNKLRSIAVRLKKKIGEQTKRIEELEQSSASPASANNDAFAANSNDTQLRNLQQLQKQNDALQDELDALRSTAKRSAEQCEALTNQLTEVTAELAAMKMINANIKASAETNSNQKSCLDQAVKEYVKQIAALKEELVGARKQHEDGSLECTQLKEKLQIRDDELTKLTTDLQKAKSSAKKNNVMNLEMEAQEKTLIDISQKLETKGLKIDELNLTIKTHEDTISSLRHQIRLLEETVDSEREHAVELKHQLDLQKARLLENDHSQSELKIRIDELQQEKNATNAALIESRLQASQSSEEKDKCVSVLSADNERHLQRLALLDSSVCELTTKLRITEHELQDLKTEFVAYKVRAQSMLRHNQQKESSREVELEDELSTVHSTNDSLNSKLKVALDQNKLLETQLADQRHEAERLQEHSKQLLQLVEETRLNADALQDEIHRQNLDHQQALKAQRLQIDTLNACYKKEIADLSEKHDRDIAAKSQQLRQQQDDQQRSQHFTQLHGDFGGKMSHPQRAAPTTDEQRIDWLLTERQDAEGSESNISQHNRKQSTSSRGPRDLIPLDELLNTSFDMATTILSDDGSASPTFDLRATKDRLNAQESRVRHLTTLLAEAEQDTARLTQLNDALKEEVRRQERSAEREQHLHNLEYLKNVMFKFLTINQGDEKAHLVPVLNTMLKLSPEETQKLQLVAKGGDNKGWRGYLPV